MSIPADSRSDHSIGTISFHNPDSWRLANWHQNKKVACRSVLKGQKGAWAYEFRAPVSRACPSAPSAIFFFPNPGPVLSKDRPSQGCRTRGFGFRLEESNHQPRSSRLNSHGLPRTGMIRPKSESYTLCIQDSGSRHPQPHLLVPSSNRVKDRFDGQELHQNLALPCHGGLAHLVGST